MTSYEVYATAHGDPRAVTEIVPARGLEFTMPLCDHGEASFRATVEPGRSLWRPALSVAMSGILICRDGVPKWVGQMTGEQQVGDRTFEFEFAEWGSAFETVPAGATALTQVNDHVIFRNLIDTAQGVPGQNYAVTAPYTEGASFSDLTINAWDTTTVEEQFRRLGESAGGPEWYIHATGTFENPGRTLVLGDRLGSRTPTVTLDYVEDTQDWVPPEAPPQLTTLGNVFPTDARRIVNGRRRGGNVIAHPARRQTPGFTAAIAVGEGQEHAQLRATAEAEALLHAGYPRRTRVARYDDVSIPATLQRHADADLAAARGITTAYTLSTLDGEPDWTQVARGDTVRVELDTDVYAGERPTVFETRVLDIAVGVQDDGPAIINWMLADVRDV